MDFRKFLQSISEELDHYTRFYDNIEVMIEFSEVYNVKDLLKAPTCFRFNAY